MGKIFFVMGKSASGKDTVYKELKCRFPGFKTVVLYTTRPVREGERDGVEYHFSTPEALHEFRRERRLVEERTYQTAHGPWSYFTVDDGQIDLKDGNYLMIGTLESYEKMREYYGEEHLIPLYLEVDDGVRLQRALDREKCQNPPKYKELCRRYLADEEDFKEENLARCKIQKRYRNLTMGDCLEEMCRDIETAAGGGECPEISAL